MARNSKKVRAKVAAVPIAIALVRAQVVGETARHCGASDVAVETAQKGLALGLLEGVTLFGLGADGRVRDEINLSFAKAEDGVEVALDLDGGKRSAVEALDAGLCESVAKIGERMRRRGLKVDVWFTYAADIRNDPDRLAKARAVLGTQPAEAPQWGDGRERAGLLKITPGKDKGMVARFFTSIKKKGGA